MNVYLPIAGLSVNVLLLVGLGGSIGFLSGLLGVGGGFLLTPLLILLGIPPVVAVGTGANQLIGAAFSGMLAHWRRRNVDLKMGLVLLAGGLTGSAFGVFLFALLRRIGQIELVIALSYVIMLGLIGGLMVRDTLRLLLRRRLPHKPLRRLHVHTWAHGLPFKMRFRRSKLYISALLPLAIGFGGGMLTALMGVGGGFVLVPAMIYFLGMPATVVVGTSLFQIIVVAANTTLLQAWTNQSVDIVLGLVLLAGGVIGAQYGAAWSSRVSGDWLRALLALIVLGVAVEMGIGLVATPDDLYALALDPTDE
jgi:uncharacterized membrane protein YfcA